MMLAELKPASTFCDSSELTVNVFSVPPGSTELEAELDKDMDVAAWEIFSCWKEQLNDRFGGGTPAPLVPASQRQYDGDNPFEFCEVWLDR